MEKNKIETLYSTDWVDLIQSTSPENGVMIGLTQKDDNVVVLPYIEENKVVTQIGVMWEHNPLRKNNYWTTAITGNVEDDETSLECAKRELKEESGYDIQDDSKWMYVGKLVMSKSVTMEHPCYIVNITGLTQTDKTGDGTENEKLSKFKLIPVSEIPLINDGFVLSMVLKMFFKKFNNIF